MAQIQMRMVAAQAKYILIWATKGLIAVHRLVAIASRQSCNTIPPSGGIIFTMGIEQKNEINYIAQQENLSAYILCAFFC